MTVLLRLQNTSKRTQTYTLSGGRTFVLYPGDTLSVPPPGINDTMTVTPTPWKHRVAARVLRTMI